MNQTEKVLSHLRNHGYITQVIASNYGIRSCSSRISELKNRGHNVRSKLKKDDAGVRYAYYTLGRRK
jgi:hypothetical protein